VLRTRTRRSARATSRRWLRGLTLLPGLLGVFMTLLSGPATAADDPLAAYAGKVVLVDFWASWCVPCRRSFPWMNAMHRKYGDDGLVILGVNLDNDATDARDFLAEYPADFVIHYDTDKSLARRFEVEAMPSAFLLDGTGRIVDQHLGFKVKQQHEYEAAIRAALGKE
jgi:thiol-disulfide isomerase/thioredoxin